MWPVTWPVACDLWPVTWPVTCDLRFGPAAKRPLFFYKRSFRYTRIWYGNTRALLTQIRNAIWQSVWNGGVDGPRRLVRVVILVHLPFSSRSLDPSLFQACLWRALYVVLLGPGCLIRTVWKYNVLLLFTDIIFIIHLCPIFLRRLSTVALLRERRPWFAGRYLSTFWRGFTEHASWKKYLQSAV